MLLQPPHKQTFNQADRPGKLRQLFWAAVTPLVCVALMQLAGCSIERGSELQTDSGPSKQTTSQAKHDQVKSPSDCTSIEKFDAKDQSCYYECDTDAECESKQAKIDSELENRLAGSKLLTENGSGRQPAKRPANSKRLTLEDTGSDTGGSVYTVRSGPSLIPRIKKRDHKNLWSLTRIVFGDRFVTDYLNSFEVFDDPETDLAASVWPSDRANKWHMNVNLAYADAEKDLIHTLVHEFSHVLTLSSPEVSTKATSKCETLKLQEGCSAAESWINVFYDRFWKQYPEQDRPKKEGQNSRDVQKFYDQHKADFVSEYAASNPVEDLAETFAHFILRKKPTGGSTSKQKVLFLYEYPELRSLRNEIRGDLVYNYLRF